MLGRTNVGRAPWCGLGQRAARLLVLGAGLLAGAAAAVTSAPVDEATQAVLGAGSPALMAGGNAPVRAASAGCRRGATPGDERPRIGLVLGGGGARGFAHVAVLKELERQNIPVDCIAGTSFGALVGGLYATGMSADQIEAALRGLDWGAMFEDDVARPHRSFRRKRDDDLSLLSTKPGIGNGGIRLAPGLLAGEQAMLMLERMTEPVATRDDFDELPIPFRAVATDLNTGEAAVLGHGNLASAMRASLSIPGVFRPVARDGTFLVDGGLANQLPVDVVRAMGADIVIAVDVGSPLRRLDESAGPLDIVDQISGFMTVGSARAQIATLGPRDVLLRPDLGDEVTTDGFDQLETALRIGAEAMRAESGRLAALALGRSDYRELVAARPAPAETPPVIDFVRLDNKSRYSDSMLLARLDIPLGEPLDNQRVQAGLARIYGMDTLELATYDVVEEDGRAGIVVTVVPHSYGPNYLETGLSAYSDFNGDFWFSLRAGVLRAPWNDRGGELRGLVQLGDEPGLLVEAYQPIGTEGRWFLLASASVESPRFSAYDADGERIATYRAPNWGGEISLGREYGNYGSALLTLRRREGHAELELGAPVVNELDYDQGEAELSLIFDRIDSTWLPRAGDYGSFTARLSRPALGGDADFEQYGLDLLSARGIGRHSGFAGLRWHVSSDDPIPVPSQYRLGGLTRFAGYRPNERLADNYWLAYGGYTYELGRVWNRAAVLGATLEYGKAWDLLGNVGEIEPEIHGSVYFGFDSWLGPLQLGYGIREGGEGIFLLELGRQR